MKHIGYLWNNKDLEIIELDGDFYVLSGWNGEVFYHCWKVLDENGFDRADERFEFVLKPVDIENENGVFETVDYILMEVRC